MAKTMRVKLHRQQKKILGGGGKPQSKTLGEEKPASQSRVQSPTLIGKRSTNKGLLKKCGNWIWQEFLQPYHSPPLLRPSTVIESQACAEVCENEAGDLVGKKEMTLRLSREHAMHRSVRDKKQSFFYFF